MKTVREKVIEQIRLQEKMQSLAKVNLVTCGNCGTTLLHDMNKDKIDCFACGDMLDQSDCPDYWYSGLENSEEYNREEMTPYKESQRVNSEIDAWASALGIEVNEPIELSTIIIPKEEPKFENSIENTINVMSIANSMFGTKQETLEEYQEALKQFPEYDQYLERIGFEAGAKWQAERSYSEEEAGELVYNIIGEYAKHYGIMIDGSKLNELFEQFKKK